jgi:hypothetical protein
VERDATPATPTWHQLDSLFKASNIYTKVVGPFDTANKYINRDVIMRVFNLAQEYRGRDSSFLFLGEGCLEVELRLGTDTTDMDTLIWRDKCDDACFDSVTVDLGCWKDSIITHTDTITQRICDTACYADIPVVERRWYYAWQGLGAIQMMQISCAKTWKQGAVKMVLYAGQWYQPMDTVALGTPFYPAADSCYVDPYVWSWIMQEFASPYSGRAGLGPWEVDTTITGGTRAVPVDCDLYGTPGVYRVLTNCRDTLITTTRTDNIPVFVDSGRDTTIYENGCDCLIPVFVCSEIEDSVRTVKYIYCYTADTTKVICEKEYAIPQYDYYPQWPIPRYDICIADPELDTAYTRWLQLRWLYGTSARTSATQRHVRLLPPLPGGADSCWSWSCQTLEDVPPVGSSDFWIESAEIDAYFPCLGPECILDSLPPLIITDWCCEKDTTVTYTCYFEDGSAGADTTKTFKIPDRTQLCHDSTITGIVPTDSSICDSIVTWVKTYKTIYLLSHTDTCCYTPTLNGVPFCDLWIVDDCSGLPLYQDERGVWHIPCGEVTVTDYDLIIRNDMWMSERLDSLRRLNDFTQGAGRVYGGRITDNGDGTVSIGAGLGLVKTATDTIASSPLDCATCPDGLSAPVSRTIPVHWDSAAVLHVVDSAYNFIYYDYSGDSIAATTNFYSIDFHQDFTLGRVYRMGARLVNRLCGTNVWEFDRRLQLAGEELFPVERATGIDVSAGAFRSVAVTAGVVWAELVNRFTTPAIDSRTDSMRSWIRSGTGWRDTMVTAIDSINYDDGTEALQPLTANRYGVHWIYVVHDGTLHHVYGRGDYTLLQAQEAGVPTLPGELSAYATLRAKIIIQKSATSFYSIESPDDVRFTVSPVATHNDLSGLQGGTTNEYYHLTAAELAETGKIAGINDKVTVHQTAIDGIRDSLSFAWLDSSYTSSFTPALRGNIVYYLDATGGNIDITLPAAASATGKEYVFKRIGDGGANTVTIKATVDADENPTMAEWQSYRIRSNGSAWYYIE